MVCCNVHWEPFFIYFNMAARDMRNIMGIARRVLVQINVRASGLDSIDLVCAISLSKLSKGSCQLHSLA